MPECAAAEAAGNRLFVLVLQHPQERREPRATAEAAVAALQRARLVVGLSWPNLSHALGRRADPHRWAVLYLGSAQPSTLAQTMSSPADVILLGRGGAPVGDAEPIFAGLDGVVLLDGTWSQAKTLWWRNPWLLKLHRLVLNPPARARYDQLRREPRREALSTLEAIALVLRRLDRGPQAADALLAGLDRLMAARRPRRNTISDPA